LNNEASDSKKISRKEREKIRLRGEIIAAASRLFSVHSYEDTSMQQIAEETDVSVGTIYNLFNGKEEIFLALVKLIIEDLTATIQEAAENNPDPVDKIRTFFRTYLDFCEKHLDSMLVIHHENPVKMHGLLNDFFQKQLSILKNYYLAAIESQNMVCDDPGLMAAVTFGYIHSYAHMISIERDTGRKDELISLFNRTLLQSP